MGKVFGLTQRYRDAYDCVRYARAHDIVHNLMTLSPAAIVQTCPRRVREAKASLPLSFSRQSRYSRVHHRTRRRRERARLPPILAADRSESWTEIHVTTVLHVGGFARGTQKTRAASDSASGPIAPSNNLASLSLMTIV